MTHAVRYHRGGALHDGTLVSDADGVRLRAEPAPAGSPRLDGVVSGRFTDHHVHLQLVDPSLLPASRLGRVIDLGADIEAVRSLREALGPSSEEGEERTPAQRTDVSSTVTQPPRLNTPSVEVTFAGPFLTAPGGYPSDRDWAPQGAVIELRDTAHAASVVADLATAGATALKAVAHSDAGPVLGDDLIRELVRLAAEHRLPLIVHAEGAGQAQRAARLGAVCLAHAPFSERLDDGEIARQATSLAWISTIAIHDDEHRAVAIDNVRRFAAAGGTVLYGTDMGNGPTPVDLNAGEVAALREAGFDGSALLAALAPLDPLIPGTPLLLVPEADPARARLLTHADLQNDEPAPSVV